MAEIDGGGSRAARPSQGVSARHGAWETRLPTTLNLGIPAGNASTTKPASNPGCFTRPRHPRFGSRLALCHLALLARPHHLRPRQTSCPPSSPPTHHLTQGNCEADKKCVSLRETRVTDVNSHPEMRTMHRGDGLRWSAQFDLRRTLAPKEIQEKFAGQAAE